MLRFPSLLFIISLSATAIFSQDAVSILRAEIERTARQRDEARKEFLEIQTEAESQIRSLSGTQLELSRRLETAGKSLLELEAEAGRSAVAVERAEAEIAKRDQALTELKKQLSENQQALEALKALPQEERSSQAQQELEQTLQAQQSEIESLQQSRDQALADRQALEDLNNELRDSLQATKRSESLSNAKLAALESRLNNLNQELGRLYEERSDLEQEQERLKGVIQDLQARLSEAEKNSVPRSDLEALQSVLAAAQDENRKLRDELEDRRAIPDLRVAFAAAERERDLLQAKQKTLTSKVTDLEESLQKQRASTREEREQRRGLEAQLGREKQVTRDLEREIRKLEAGLSAATAAGIDQAELAEVSMLLADLQEENAKLKNQSQQSREEAERLMEELTNEDSTKTLQIRELQTMLGEQMIQLTDAQRKIDSLEAKTITLDSVRLERDNLIQVREKSRKDMKTLATHIYELRDQMVESREMQNQLKVSGLKQQQLQQEIEKQQRLTRALLQEQARKDQQILEMKKRLAAEANPAPAEPE